MLRSLTDRLGRRRRARAMMRRLARLERRDARTLRGVARPTTRKHPPVGTWTALAVTAVLTGVVVLYNPMTGGAYLRETLGLGHRQGSVQIPDGGGQYAFVTTQPGSRTPVSYDPCRPIHVRVNPAGGPRDWARLVDGALERVGGATGFRFVVDGVTTERPYDRGPDATRGPVVIGWETAAQNHDLAGDVAGVGGSVAIENRPGHLTYVTGDVALDSDWFAEMADQDDRFTAERAVLLHELGHVVGLAHVASTHELMYRSASRADFGPGDLEGLARLGNISCG